jgi:hypothetical protein
LAGSNFAINFASCLAGEIAEAVLAAGRFMAKMA